MAILQKLIDLGFKAEVVGKDAQGIETMKIRTSKGWTYDRFSREEDVENWAKYHKPEGQ